MQYTGNLVSENFETYEKGHNAKATSKEAFRIITESGQRVRQKHIVCDTIKDFQPITSRRLAEITRQERTSITRSLYDLLHEENPVIKEAFTDVCPTTGKRVTYYSMIWWTKKPLVGEQLKLIQ